MLGVTMEKKLGRPFAEVKKVRKQVYLMPSDAATLKALAESDNLSESALIEKILLKAFKARAKKI